MVKEKMLAWVIQMAMERLTSEDMKAWMDKGLDMLEETIAKSPNQYDDMVGLPLIKLVRDSFSIPDND